MTLMQSALTMQQARIRGGHAQPQWVRLADSPRDIREECDSEHEVTAYFRHDQEQCLHGNDPWSAEYATCATLTGWSIRDNTGTQYLTAEQLVQRIGGAAFQAIEEMQTELVR